MAATLKTTVVQSPDNYNPAGEVVPGRIIWRGNFLDGTLTVVTATPAGEPVSQITWVVQFFGGYCTGTGGIDNRHPEAMDIFMQALEKEYYEFIYMQREAYKGDGDCTCH